MDLSDLAVFRAVVRAGGVTRAAEQLHRVQSNVTTRIKKLENELGVQLFVREGRRMTLSPRGRVLVEYADRLFALADEAKNALRDDRPRGVLKLGAMESTAAVRLPAPLAAFHRRNPDLSVELHTGNPQQMMTDVINGALDAALVAEPVADQRLASLKVYDEELVVVTSRDHPPVRAPRDVRTRTLLAFHPGCPHRMRLEQWFARSGMLPDRISELASYHAILGCAAVGMGIALMPKSVVDAYANRNELGVYPMRRPFGSVRTLLVWRRDSPQAKVSALADALVNRSDKNRASSSGRGNRRRPSP